MCDVLARCSVTRAHRLIPGYMRALHKRDTGPQENHTRIGLMTWPAEEAYRVLLAMTTSLVLVVRTLCVRGMKLPTTWKATRDSGMVCFGYARRSKGSYMMCEYGCVSHHAYTYMLRRTNRAHTRTRATVRPGIHHLGVKTGARSERTVCTCTFALMVSYPLSLPSRCLF